MNAADRLRHYTLRSNQLHERYLNDPELLDRYQRFVTWQLAYMLPFYDDLRQSADTRAAIDFIVSDLAGIGISERDHEIQRVIPAMARMLPAKALRVLAAGMEQNARILEINLAICDAYYANHGIEIAISEKDYCAAAREAVTLTECLGLVQLTRQLGSELDRVIHIPLLGVTLMTMRLPARLAGFGTLQSFLEKGYLTFRSLDNVDQFLDLAEKLMQQLFERIYNKPLCELQQ